MALNAGSPSPSLGPADGNEGFLKFSPTKAGGSSPAKEQEAVSHKERAPRSPATANSEPSEEKATPVSGSPWWPGIQAIFRQVNAAVLRCWASPRCISHSAKFPDVLHVATRGCGGPRPRRGRRRRR